MGPPKLWQHRANGASPVVSPANDEKSQRTSPQFLIASDDDRLCRTANAALRQLGYPATFVRSGVDVLNSIDPHPPRLVLLDQCLRDLVGLEVARALSADKHQQFVLIGNGLTTSVTVAAMKLGAFTVLEKPVALTDMIALLRSFVDEPRKGKRLTNTPTAALHAPGSVAERWAFKVLKGCEADGDLRTLSAWATVAGAELQQPVRNLSTARHPAAGRARSDSGPESARQVTRGRLSDRRAARHLRQAHPQRADDARGGRSATTRTRNLRRALSGIAAFCAGQ